MVITVAVMFQGKVQQCLIMLGNAQELLAMLLFGMFIHVFHFISLPLRIFVIIMHHRGKIKDILLSTIKSQLLIRNAQKYHMMELRNAQQCLILATIFWEKNLMKNDNL